MINTNATEDFIQVVQDRMASLISSNDGDFKFAAHQLVRIYKSKCKGVLYLPMMVDDKQIILT